MKIKLEITPAAMKSRIWLDGVELTNVIGVELRAHLDKATEVTLHLRGVQVEVEGDVNTVLVDKSSMSTGDTRIKDRIST